MRKKYGLKQLLAEVFLSFDLLIQLGATATLPPPTPLSPGTNSSPGETISTTTPTFSWTGVSGASRYGLYISKPPYGESNLVYQNENLTGTSFTIPSGYLVSGGQYRWNMTTFNSSGQNGSFSSPLYFQVASPAQSDLIIRNLTVNPNSGSGGSSATVSFTIYNQGSGTANASTTNIRINTSSTNVTTSDPLLTSISTPSISAGGSYNVSQTVTIPSNRPTGTNYIWVILDVNSTANQSNEDNDYGHVTFTVTATLPPPTPIYPGTSSSPGETISTTTPTFSWTGVSGASRYGLYISRYPYGPSNLIPLNFPNENLTGTSFTIPAGNLVSGEKYRWNMVSFDANGNESSVSNVLYFQVYISVNTPSAPVLIYPTSGETIFTTTPTLQWTPVSNADYYGVQIKDIERNSIVYSNENLVYNTTLSIPEGLLEYKMSYEWSVRSHNSAGWGSSSPSQRFVIGNPSFPEASIIRIS